MYIYDWILTLDTPNKLVLLDVHHEISGFHVAGNREGDFQLCDGLRPLVGQSSLLFNLFGSQSGLLSWRGFWE